MRVPSVSGCCKAILLSWDSSWLLGHLSIHSCHNSHPGPHASSSKSEEGRMVNGGDQGRNQCKSKATGVEFLPHVGASSRKIANNPGHQQRLHGSGMRVYEALWCCTTVKHLPQDAVIESHCKWADCVFPAKCIPKGSWYTIAIFLTDCYLPAFLTKLTLPEAANIMKCAIYCIDIEIQTSS